MTRENAEIKLLDNECNTIESMVDQGDLSYIHDIFYSGFKGYAHFTDKEIEQEYLEQLGETITIKN